MKFANDLWEYIWQETGKMGELEGKRGALENIQIWDVVLVLLAKNPHTYHFFFPLKPRCHL